MFTFILNWLRKYRASSSVDTVPEKNSSSRFQIPKQVHLHWHVSDSSQIAPHVIWNAGQLVTPNVSAGHTSARIYDKELLDRARMQWQFGEWETLSEIDLLTVESHPDRAKLALVVASAWLQLGNSIQARQFTQHAKEWGCDKKLMAQLLIAGVHNTLGRVASLNGDEVRAMTHFRDAVKGVSGDAKLASQARASKEFQRLGRYSYEQTKQNRSLCRSTKNIKKILITGDVLRPSGDGNLSQESNINWLYTVIGSQIASVFDQNDQANSKVTVFTGNIENNRDIYRALGFDFTENSWAKIYNSELTEYAENILSTSFGIETDMVVIGFELSPAIRNFLCKKQIVYIDIRISPYRYLDDLLLNFSSNDNDINIYLKKHEVSPYVMSAAANVERFKRRNINVDIAPRSLIFFGQAPLDASLIESNRFDSYINYVDQIIAIKNDYEACYYKPHPYVRDQEAIDFFQNIGFSIIDNNVYDLLSSRKLELAIGINSSVLYEVNFFEKKVIKLSNIDIYENTYCIQDCFLSSNFWADVLTQRKPISSFNMPNQPNRLRESLGWFWGKTV